MTAPGLLSDRLPVDLAALTARRDVADRSDCRADAPAFPPGSAPRDPWQSQDRS